MPRLSTTSLLFVVLALAGPHGAYAGNERVVSLESLVQAARQNHPTLAKQPLLADSLELQHRQMNRAYWPQLSFGASATWQSTSFHIDIPIPGVMISPPPKDQYNATLNLQQNLWDGGLISEQKRVAARRTELEQERVKLEWYQVHDRMLQLYFAGIVQQELKAQAEILDGYLDRTLATAQLALNNGVTTERDVLLVKARQLEAKQAIADASAQLVSVHKSLEELAGIAVPAETRLQASAMRCGTADESLADPREVHRPELSILAAQAELLDAQENLELAVDRPKLGAFATAGYGRPGLNPLSDTFDSYFIGGVQLTVPLTYLYARTHRDSKQELAVQHSLLARQQDAVMTQVRVQLDAQHAELLRLDAAIALDEQLLQVRTGARKQTELQLALGTATMTDLVSDLSEEDRARSRGAVHRAQRDFACYQLAFIKGDL